MNFNKLNMRAKERMTYNPSLDEFKYLKKNESSLIQRVDINVLNKRLNTAKRSNFYTTTLVATLCLSCLALLSLISIKF